MTGLEDAISSKISELVNDLTCQKACEREACWATQASFLLKRIALVQPQLRLGVLKRRFPQLRGGEDKLIPWQ
jgi:hypothetical protein